jgi:DNA (cytosine-5)-methyltransferase 1
VTRSNGERFTVAGLFAGIGGIEQGLAKAGHVTQLMCEIESGARRVLKSHFSGIPIRRDIREVKSLPPVGVVAAGFPCQDLSQAGRTAGIGGAQSSLVGEVFRLLAGKKLDPQWLVLENVPFMLQLERGRAMRYLVDALEALGFMWAYRVVDARAFGIPQRRQRVILLASRTNDPRPVLFGQDAGEQLPAFSGEELCGFYWTEGSRGLGWAVDAVPTLKGGSTIGIPSPPAIWDPVSHTITTPDIRDAERLQGFAEDWTAPALKDSVVRRGHRWKLIGNAVSVSMAKWIGDRLVDQSGKVPEGALLKRGVSWPRAAWGRNEKVYMVDVTTWPQQRPAETLRAFLKFPRAPLSLRATTGFYSRAIESCLNFEDGFLKDVKLHIDRMSQSAAASHVTVQEEHSASA